MQKTIAILMLAGGLLMWSAAAKAEAPLTVAAAPSMRAAFHAIVPMFEKEFGTTVRVLYGPSETIRRQIEGRAPIDVWLSPGMEDLEDLQARGRAARVIGQTSLVVVMASGSPAMSISFHDTWPDRTTRIALADPRTSALGTVTAHALANLDPSYKKKHARLAYAPHGEGVVEMLHAGKADVGIVYRVDAINSGRVRIIEEVPTGTLVPVQFGGAVVKTAREDSLSAADQFLDFITSARIQKLLLHYGFEPVVVTAAVD